MSVRKDLIGSVLTYPPNSPSTVTATVRTPAEPFKTVPVVLDSVSTTVAVQAYENDRDLTLASSAGIVPGRLYRAGTQTVKAQSVTGPVLTLAQPLAYDLAPGAVLIGLAATIALTVDDTAQEGTGLVRWSSDLDTWDQTFEIETQTAQAYTLRAPGLTTRLPIANDLRSPDDEDFEDAIRAGWYRLKRDLDAQGIDLSLIRSWAAMEDAHAHATVLTMVMQSPRMDEDMQDIWQSEYHAARAAFMASRSFWYDQGDDLAQDDKDLVLRKSWSL